MPWRRKWQPTPEFLTGKSHKQRSLVGYSPWICKRVGQDLVTKYHHMPLWGSRASPHPWLKEAPCSKRHIKHLPNQGNSPYIRCWENKHLSIRYIHTQDYVILKNWCFYHLKCYVLPLTVIHALIYILMLIKVTPTFLHSVFVWYTFLHPSIFFCDT